MRNHPKWPGCYLIVLMPAASFRVIKACKQSKCGSHPPSCLATPRVLGPASRFLNQELLAYTIPHLHICIHRHWDLAMSLFVYMFYGNTLVFVKWLVVESIFLSQHNRYVKKKKLGMLQKLTLHFLRFTWLVINGYIFAREVVIYPFQLLF